MVDFFLISGVEERISDGENPLASWHPPYKDHPESGGALAVFN